MKNFNKEIKSWIFYDFGNSAYATTVIAAFFPLFYASYWSNGLESLQATQYLAFALTIINLVILISAPIIGAITDYKRLTKILFVIFTLLSIIAVASFYFIPMGKWLMALILYGISFFSFASAIVLYDKMLVYIASEDQLTKVSSYGYSLGYLGGGLLFALNAFMVLQPETFGLSNDFFSSIHSFNHGSNLSSGKNQCFVSFKTGLFPLKADFGFIKSVGLNDVPHFSH